MPRFVAVGVATVVQIIGSFAAPSTAARRDIAEYDAARGERTWDDVRSMLISIN